ncbi:MAG: hypothetical protein JWQ73_107 [Variovorax sp.]|jgi:hypothetical protein|nr:hypothetical protein [Variovorax sp.]
MLRWIFFALVALNLGYFLWSGDGGPAAGSEREPQRLGQQVRPQMLQIRKGDAVAPTTPAPAPTSAAAAITAAPATDANAAR